MNFYGEVLLQWHINVLTKKSSGSGIKNVLLCVIDVYSKSAWVAPFKDKKGITITKSLQKVLHES